MFLKIKILFTCKRHLLISDIDIMKIMTVYWLGPGAWVTLNSPYLLKFLQRTMNRVDDSSALKKL